MDPLTHALVGGLAAKTVGTSKRRFWIMCLLGSAPDIDVIFNMFGGWAWLIQHRGLSHSLLGVVVQSVLLAAILGKWDPGPFKQRIWHYSLPISAHVLCDYLTAFGVPLLSPFSVKEYSAGLMVGLTLIPIFIMSVGLIWMHSNGEKGWKATRPVWIGWGLYMVMAFSAKAYAGHLVNAEAGAVALPSTGNPFSWSVVYPDYDSRSYRRYKVDLMKGVKHVQEPVPMPALDWPILVSSLDPAVKDLMDQARWPVARSRPSEKGWNVEWGNILFSTRGLVRGKLRVQVDADGTVHPAERIFSFWDPELPRRSNPSSI